LTADAYLSLQSGMLMNEKYYHLSLVDATSLQSNSQSIIAIPGVFVIFCCGYIYDIFGRRFSIFYMLLFGGLSLVFFPIVAPSQTGFISMVFIFGVCVGGLG
jgi:MFS family permease